MRSIVVTGGSRGLGLGIVKALALSHPDRIIVPISRSITPLLEELTAKSFNVRPLQWDLSETDSLSELASTIKLSAGPIYGLVNNAGIGLSGILSNTSDSKIEDVVQMNVIAPMLLTKYLVRSMMLSRCGGCIVNISSIVATTGYQGLSAYSATKSAMIGFTRSLARELGPLGITVNAVAPGFIDTEMTNDLNPKQRDKIAHRSALQRMATIEDVASSVDFLMSTKAKNITGTVVTVDAGNTA
ncbi:unnamed protein product [Sphagnum tenellum]